MISDKPHPQGQGSNVRLVTWGVKATVTGYGTDPEPHLILRLGEGHTLQYLHVPMADFKAINDWQMRSKVNLRIELDNLP
jgi:hypothetical protein